eukprot:scaffold16257_cov124-Isochrysis_galbana.AAC.1
MEAECSRIECTQRDFRPMPTMHASPLPPPPPGPFPKLLRRGVQPTSRQFVRNHPPGRASTPAAAAGPRRHRRRPTRGSGTAAHMHTRADPVRVERE